MDINVKEARSRFSNILSQVEGGQEVVITRRGKAVARLVPYAAKGQKLPSLKEFRASIRIAGEPLSKTVVHNRNEDRL